MTERLLGRDVVLTLIEVGQQSLDICGHLRMLAGYFRAGGSQASGAFARGVLLPPNHSVLSDSPIHVKDMAGAVIHYFCGWVVEEGRSPDPFLCGWTDQRQRYVAGTVHTFQRTPWVGDLRIATNATADDVLQIRFLCVRGLYRAPWLQTAIELPHENCD